MRKPRVDELLLPVMMLAFVGLAVTFLAPVFNTTTRWAILAFAAFYLLLKGRLLRPPRTHFELLTLAFALWSLMTVIWSEVPMLSLLKGGAFIIIAYTCMAAGEHWVSRHAPGEALGYLLPLVVVALLAGVLGRFSEDALVQAGGMMLYQGMVGGPNMFGSMLAMCFPFLLWRTYAGWRSPRRRLLWLILCAIALYYLLVASSRGSILVVLSTLVFFSLSLGAGRRVQLIIVLSAALLSGFVLVPGRFEQLQQQILYKHATQEEGVLHTREQVWEESFELARQGGWMGGGYGVTIGDRSFEAGVTAVGYGREKGNSQLAIVEETGLVGLAIYLVSLFLLFARLGKSLLGWPRGPEKVLLGIMVGALAGMIAQSVFEAWWVAPSSPESAYFWTLAGATLAYARLKRAPARMGNPVGGRQDAGPIVQRPRRRTDSA